MRGKQSLMLGQWLGDVRTAGRFRYLTVINGKPLWVLHILDRFFTIIGMILYGIFLFFVILTDWLMGD